MPQRYIVSFGSSVLPDEWNDFRCTNTLYYQGVQGAVSGEAVAQSIADAYAVADGAFVFGAIEVRAYDFDGVLPTGAPVATAVAQQAGTLSIPGPREVACALSYRAGPSTPRSRGRIFIGPLAGSIMVSDRVTAAVGNGVNLLGQRLAGIVTLGAQWSLYSRTVQAFAAITNWSVDNAWDTQRSRGLPATADF